MLRKVGAQLDRPLAAIERLAVFLGCILLWGIVALILLQMFGRVVLRTGLPWPDELARYFHIVLVFLGLAFAHRLRTHVDVQFFTAKWPPLAQRLSRNLVDLTIVATSVIVVAGGIALAARMGAQRSPSLGLPLTYFVGATIFGFALLGAEAVRQILRSLSSSDTPEIDTTAKGSRH